MYNKGKLIRGFGRSFASYSLIIFYATATILFWKAEGAQALYTASEVKEARKLVGHFLSTEKGTAWLQALAKSNSAPLKAADLMKAILQTTKEGDPVWQAATTLIETLKSQDSIGTRLDTTTEQNDNWKDLLGDIEMEDDIICLYRKSANETTKRAEDWQKFLRSVSPGYVVHLAIDTGRKYVICLKKIDVPDMVSQKNATTKADVTSTSLAPNAVSPSERMIQPSAKDGGSTSSTPAAKSSPLRDETLPEQSAKPCKGKSTDAPNDARSSPPTGLRANRRGMDDRANAGDLTNIDYKLIDKEDDYWRRYNRPRLNYLERMSESFVPEVVRYNECGRPVVLVISDRTDLAARQRPPAIEYTINDSPASHAIWPIRDSRFYPGYFGSRYPFSTLSDPTDTLNSANLRLPIFGYNDVGGYRPQFPQNVQSRPKMSHRPIGPAARRTTQPIGTNEIFPLPTVPSPKFNGFNKIQGRFAHFVNPSYGGMRRFPPRLNESPAAGMKTLTGSNIEKNVVPSIFRSFQFDRRNAQPIVTRNQIPLHPAQFNRIARYLPLRFDQPRNVYGDRYIGNPVNYQEPIGRPLPIPLKTFINAQPRAGTYYKPFPAPRPFFNENIPPAMPNAIGTDPRIVAFPRPTRTVPCKYLRVLRNHQLGSEGGAPYYTSTTLLNPKLRSSPPLYQFPNTFSHNPAYNRYPAWMNPTQRADCSRSCDRPIKLEILIKGKVQEPGDVDAHGSVWNKWESFDSADPTIPYRPRVFKGSARRFELFDKDFEPDIPASNEEISSTKNKALVESHSSESTTKSSVQSKMESTTVSAVAPSSETVEIEHRILYTPTTSRSNSSVKASDAMSTTRISTTV